MPKREFTYITETKILKAFCQRAQQSAKLLAVDTEFARETTYYPKLSTIQIATEAETVLVDALAENLDLSPLKEVFLNKGITKIFHAARQDLEIFYQLWGDLPTPIADTQILAMICGFGDSIGYQGLVQSLMKIELDKVHRISDWLQRPLSKAQVTYAMGDVLHLHAIYKKLLERGKDRLAWVQEEYEALLDINNYDNQGETAWRRINISGPLSLKQFSILSSLASWREATAIQKDKPRHHIIKDAYLKEITLSSRPEKLLTYMLKKKQIDVAYEKDILACVRTPDTNITVPDSLSRIPLRTYDGLVLELLKTLYKYKVQEHHIAPKLICNVNTLKELASGTREGLPVLKGWRYDIFGKDALALLDGNCSLSINGEHVVVNEK